MPFGLGYGEMLVFGVVAVLLFGNRLPEVARSLGRSLTEFKQGMNGLQNEWNQAVHSEPQETLTQEDREAPTGDPFAPPPPEGEQDENAPTSAAT